MIYIYLIIFYGDLSKSSSIMTRTSDHLILDGLENDIPIQVDGDNLKINGKTVHVYQIKNPEELDWKKHDIDILIESTGKFTTHVLSIFFLIFICISRYLCLQ